MISRERHCKDVTVEKMDLTTAEYGQASVDFPTTRTSEYTIGRDRCAFYYYICRCALQILHFGKTLFF